MFITLIDLLIGLKRSFLPIVATQVVSPFLHYLFLYLYYSFPPHFLSNPAPFPLRFLFPLIFAVSVRQITVCAANAAYTLCLRLRHSCGCQNSSKNPKKKSGLLLRYHICLGIKLIEICILIKYLKAMNSC